MPRNLRQTQSSQTDNASRVRTGILSAILLFVLVAALFSPSVRYPLSDLDDADYIAQNRLVTRGFAPGALRGAFDVSDTTASMYMPLLWLSYMADVTFFHASVRNPAPFHAVNVFLHALSAVFLFTLLRRLRAPPLWAFLLALLWAAHPLRVESVAWIAERKDVLSAALGLASTLAWLESARSGRGTFPRIVLLTFSLLLYAAGLLAKPSLVPLPLAWLALDVWPLRRIPASPRSPDFLPAILRAAAAKLPFLPFALVAAWLAVARHHAVSGALAVPWPTRLAAVAPNFFFYVRKTILPLRLSPLVPEQWHFSLPVILLSLLAAGTLVAVLWRFRRSLPSLLPGVVWLLLFFFPASGLQPLPMNTVADRFFYLPAMGISIALAGLPSVLLPQVRRVLYAATAFLLLPLAVLSIRLLPRHRRLPPRRCIGPRRPRPSSLRPPSRRCPCRLPCQLGLSPSRARLARLIPRAGQFANPGQLPLPARPSRTCPRQFRRCLGVAPHRSPALPRQFHPPFPDAPLRPRRRPGRF